MSVLQCCQQIFHVQRYFVTLVPDPILCPCCPVTLCRSTGNQSKDYVALGPQWKDWPQKASARPRQHRGTQRRDFAHHPHFRAERWQTRAASHASASAHCLRGKCLGAVGGRCAEDPCGTGVRPLP